jgi:hypothetical protein
VCSSDLIDLPIALSLANEPSVPTEQEVGWSAIHVEVMERIKCAAFARNPRCWRGAEVKLHKYYPSIIDGCDWTA